MPLMTGPGGSIAPKKRILIFSLTYHPFIGGAEVAIKEITDRLGDSFEFDMITLRFDKTLPTIERYGNVTVHRIGPAMAHAQVSDRNMPPRLRLAKILFPVLACMRALRLHRVRRYQLTWSMMANHAGFAGMLFKTFNPSVPHVLELQDGRAFEEMKQRQPILRLLWPLYVRVYQCADQIKVISSFLEREVRSLGVHSTVQVIPNGVDTERFTAPISESALASLRRELAPREHDIVLFTASRLVLSRGVEDTILALKHLPERARLVIAGSGDDRTALEALVREQGLSDRVRFLGHINHEDLPRYYRASDVFVRPSVIEGFGIAFVEAFASGIPVVATPVGGIPDFLSDPEANPERAPTGLFCKVHDPVSIAAAVKRYMEDTSLKAAVVENAQRLAREKYDWNDIAQRMRGDVFSCAQS